MGKLRHRSPKIQIWVFMCVYGAALLFLLSLKPLILDEILDLKTLRSPGLRALTYAIPLNAGAAPLAYFIRLPLVKLFGESAFSARLPSAFSSILSCLGIFVVARRVLRIPIVATLLFAFFPLQFRYALEARAYSQALMLSVWCTVVFIELNERPRLPLLWLCYFMCVIAGLYTQPYTIFISASHLMWLCLMWLRNRKAYTRQIVTVGLLAGCAVGCFIPWYSYGKQVLGSGVVRMYPRSTIGIHAVPMILKEIAGSGYFGTTVLLVGAASAFRAGRASWLEERWLWLCAVLVPLLGAVAADIFFVYFLAIRQVIFIVAPLTLLFSKGIETMHASRIRTLAILLVIGFGVASLYQDGRATLFPVEDWKSAATILNAESKKSATCVLFAPSDSIILYTFFEPSLTAKQCSKSKKITADAVLLATANPNDAGNSALLEDLSKSGFSKRVELTSVKPRVELYRRDH